MYSYNYPLLCAIENNIKKMDRPLVKRLKREHENENVNMKNLCPEQTSKSI